MLDMKLYPVHVDQVVEVGIQIITKINVIANVENGQLLNVAKLFKLILTQYVGKLKGQLVILEFLYLALVEVRVEAGILLIVLILVIVNVVNGLALHVALPIVLQEALKIYCSAKMQESLKEIQHMFPQLVHVVAGVGVGI